MLVGTHFVKRRLYAGTNLYKVPSSYDTLVSKTHGYLGTYKTTMCNKIYTWLNFCKQLKQESIGKDVDRGHPDFTNIISLTWNKYMLNSRYNAPKLQQIECAFWKEV